MREKLFFILIFLLIIVLFTGCPPADDDNGGGGAEGDTVNWVEGTVTDSAVYTAGSVGIGTTSPSTALDVDGVITTTGGTSTDWDTAYGWGDHASVGYLTSMSETDPTITDDSIKDGVDWSELTGIPAGFADNTDDTGAGSVWSGSTDIYYNGGNVGIGTTTPVSMNGYNWALTFQVESTMGRMGLTGSRPGLIFNENTNSTDNKIFVIEGNDMLLKFQSGSDNGATITDHMVIERSGEVGIGTISPGYELDVTGDINCTGDFYNSGVFAADYVFDEDYDVLSIEEHAKTMWENKHLPKVAGQNDLGDKPYSMSERREQILEELEIAHIYIEQLNATLNTVLDTVDVQQNIIEELQQEIDNLKDK